MLVLVDTNVLLRAATPAHPHHVFATNMLRDCRRAGHELCIVPQVHYEFWVVATRPLAQGGLGLTAADAEVQLRKLGPPMFRLLRDERAIYNAWRELVAKHGVLGKSAHDARLVAAMQRHGVTHLMTINSADFKRYPGIELLDPAKNQHDS
jgi:predicted nucleic acid-binding protein